MAESVFENNCLGCAINYLNVPRGTLIQLYQYQTHAFSIGIFALKQARLEKIPKYSPLCSPCSKVRRIFVLFSNFSFRTSAVRNSMNYKQ